MTSQEQLASPTPYGVDQSWGVWPRQSGAIGLLILLAAFLVGCGSPETANRVVESVETTSKQRLDRNLRGESIVSKESAVRLRLPRNWEPVPGNALHPEAELQAYNPNRDIYLVVLGEDQASLTNSGDLNQQAQAYLQILQGGLNQVLSQASATDVTSVNGLNAAQYSLSGEVFGTQATYLHTTVAMNDRYYQVVAWTPSERFSENREEMQAIIQEVRQD